MRDVKRKLPGSYCDSKLHQSQSAAIPPSLYRQPRTHRPRKQMLPPSLDSIRTMTLLPTDWIARSIRTAWISGLLCTSTTFLHHAPPALADTGWDASTSRLQPCPYDSNCVSSHYMEPPNRYVSPLTTKKSRDAAFAGAIRDLTTIGTIVEASPKNYYIHLTVPGTVPNSLDDLELLLVQDDKEGTVLVNLRCQSRVTLPPPPFCIQKNCINGNMDQRQRVDRIVQALGMPRADQERMKEESKWTPIFFNSDRVPGFDTDDDYEI